VARKTIRARRLGKQVRKLRERAKLSQDDLCTTINRGQSKNSTLSQGQLSKVEAGSVRLDAGQLERILTAVSADTATAERLEVLRARAEEIGWWQDYQPYLHETLELMVELGEDARRIRTYDSIFVQGLLQTEDYARTVIESAKPFVRPTAVDELVELRMRRQDRLLQPTFDELVAVVTEASLRHMVGGPKAMKAQLEKLCAITEESMASDEAKDGIGSRASIYLLPYSAGPWPGVGAFLLYEIPGTDDGDEDTEVAQVDGDVGAGIYEDRETIKSLTLTHTAALDRALPARQSLDRYRSIILELDR
jgi:transcriptional regulator with XRE-family HTH domain